MDKESTAAVMQRAKQTEIEVRHESEISFGNEAGFSVPERDIRPPRTEDKLKLLWDGRLLRDCRWPDLLYLAGFSAAEPLYGQSPLDASRLHVFH